MHMNRCDCDDERLGQVPAAQAQGTAAGLLLGQGGTLGQVVVAGAALFIVTKLLDRWFFGGKP